MSEAGQQEEDNYEAEQEEEQPVAGELFANNHDLIGVQGIIRAQKNEIEKKKVRDISGLTQTYYYSLS